MIHKLEKTIEPLTENKDLFWTSEIINTFSDVIPRHVKGLAGQLHVVARDSMPIKLDVVSNILTHGLDQLHNDQIMGATYLEHSLNEAGIILPTRLKELILTRSTRMDEEGQLLLAEHSDLIASITKELTPAIVLRAQVQSDRELIINRADRAVRPQYRKLYGQLDLALDGSINMVCYAHYLQELMRQGIKDGKLKPTHIELAHQLDADYLTDRGFLGNATKYLRNQGVLVTSGDLMEWGELANFRNSLTNPLNPSQ